MGDHEAVVPNANDLGKVITSASVRRVIYGTFVVVLVAAGAITVGFATISVLPQWVIVMNAVLSFLGVPVGGLAIANTPKQPTV